MGFSPIWGTPIDETPMRIDPFPSSQARWLFMVVTQGSGQKEETRGGFFSLETLLETAQRFHR